MTYNPPTFSHHGNLPTIPENPQNLLVEMLNPAVETKLCDLSQQQHFSDFRRFIVAHRTLFDEPLFPHMPCVNDIQQGQISNCFLLTALQAIIEIDPRYILNMMRDNRNFTVDVRLYAINPEATNPQITIVPWYIRVNKSKLVDRHGRPLSNHKAPWVFIFEKAYAYWRQTIIPSVYIPKHDVLEGNVWVRRPISSNVLDQGARQPITLVKALESGTVREALQYLLGTPAHHTPLQREEIVKNDDGEELSIYEPLRHLHNILTMRSTNYHLYAESQQLVFGQNYQIFTNFLAPEITSGLRKAFDNLISTNGHIIRSHILLQLIDIHLTVLQTTEMGRNIYKNLSDYIKTHFPEKRGSIDYTRKQLGEFEHIFQLLLDNNIVSVSTREKIGDPHRQLSQAEGNRVRGLAGNHAYQVLDIFKRINGLCYVLLRNPWGNYGRSYITRESSRDAPHMLGDKIIPIEKRFVHIEWCKLPVAQAAHAAHA